MADCLELKNEITGRVWNNGPSMVTVFSVQSGFRRNCGDGGDKCIWVAKRDGSIREGSHGMRMSNRYI
ncbi:unnamed protein product [Eruca vesicaria subsp. sativa]|uniref:Uncharacterized protein n=1 Tax=Eruca vesicaria subsp. sativa TaxID=29727 RepID=A0ABC8KX55_ERUVS|nr:unnamed protein product [Eruca vesicaria subsp. sativa]